MLNFPKNQKGVNTSIIIVSVSVLILIIVAVLIFTNRNEEPQPAAPLVDESQINQELEEPLDIFPMVFTNLPNFAVPGEKIELTYQVNPSEPTIIMHTAIHWDVESHAGELGLEVTAVQAGYPNITPEFTSGEFQVPDDFTVSVVLPENVDKVFLRAHAVIEGQNFWTTEQELDLFELTVDDLSVIGEPVVDETNGQPDISQTAVFYNDDGFSPREITISKGDSVTFLNQSSRNFWPATVVHPTHTIYPGSSRSKCSSAEADKMFDACKALGPGEAYSFIFNEVGDWKFHDHLRASLGGVINVQ